MTQTEDMVLWSPDPGPARQSGLARFAAQSGFDLGVGTAAYHELWNWSVSDLDGFWSGVWQYFGLDRYYPAETVLAEATMPGARWFPGTRLNLADYVLSRGEPDKIAIVGATESGVECRLTWAELRRQVGALAWSLRERGVTSGDRVVGYLPNIPQAVIAFLATALLGAIWSSVGQDYAAQAVLDRIGQLDPTVLITASGYRYRGRWHDRSAELTRIRAGLPTLQATVLVTREGHEQHEVVVEDSLDWDDLVAGTAAPEPELVAFDHPLWVLFSSGTTGLPKGIVHGHGGVLLEQLKFLGLHSDLGPKDRFFWYCSPSWVMWNIQTCGLATGASIVCYDGSPTSPGPEHLWRVVADHGVSVFGSSPGFLEASRKAAVLPTRDFDLSCLRLLSTSGSPIAPVTHAWATTETGGLPLFSISGGTDIASAFCGGAPTVDIRAGEIPVRCLGVAMHAWDEQSRPAQNRAGELVVTRPMPSMPVRFWNDEQRQRYRDAYFATYPGVWRHGDWITITERGSVLVHGRSDSTLNRNGIRMGSADIYNALEQLPDVLDALVLGVEQPDGGYWMPLFVVLPEGQQLDQGLGDRIIEAIKTAASPRHVPDEIIPMPGIPRTKTGKRLEVPLKRLFQGASATEQIQTTTVDDPELLNPYLRLAAERAGRNDT